MKNIYGLTIDEIEDYFIKMGSKKFHALQLFSWLYEKRIESFTDITNIKKELIDSINKDFSINRLKIVDVQEDVDVCKYLFELYDNEHIEAVLMKHDYGNSICVSSQVGCNMGCKFCESGRRRKIRNLETYEMVLQILMIEKLFGKRISHVVVMGIGEPFDNYDNLIKFFRIINHPKGLAIGARHITVSTCGLVPKILEFSEFPLQINLAISLHAPNDKIRNKIMPISKAYPMKELINSLKKYLEKTNRRITFEYILLKNGESKKIQDRVKTEFIYVIDISKVDLEKKVLGINCPNCGSPITSLGLKKCSYCGSIIKELFSKIFTCNDIVRY